MFAACCIYQDEEDDDAEKRKLVLEEDFDVEAARIKLEERGAWILEVCSLTWHRFLRNQTGSRLQEIIFRGIINESLPVVIVC